MKQKAVKLSSRDMLLSIGSMVERLKSLLNQGKKYDAVATYLINLNYFYDENARLPSIKDLCTATGIDYTKVRKQIQEIYFDLIGLNDHEFHPFSFNAIRYTFTLRSMYDQKYIYFEVDTLPAVPRVGENIDLPYFRAYLGKDTFHVESIDHRLDERGQEIHFMLRPGSFNAFIHYRMAQALEENDINIQEFFEMTDFDLKRRLKIGGL